VTDVVLGVDLGTTGAKVGALELAADGSPAGDGVAQPVAHAPVPWATTSTGAEIDPDLLADVVLGALDAACKALPGARVRAVGLASFAESVVLLDVDGRPLAPMVAWHDTRGGPEAEDLGRTVGADDFSSRTGLPVSALASAAKVRALAGAGLDLSRVATVLSATDWVAHRLAGTCGFDLSLASRTGWLELASRDWAPDLLGWTGLPDGALPPVLPAGSARGTADREDLPQQVRGALVVVAGMDHHVAAVGAGAASPGDVWDSCGTAEAFLRSTEPLPPASVLDAVRRGLEVGWHADPMHQVVLGAQRSGYAFQRALTLLGVGSSMDLRELEAAGAPTTDLPGLDGVYDEHYALTALTSRSRREHVWAALVDRVAADGARLLQEIDAVAGPRARVVMGGGWAESAWFTAAKRRHLPDVTATTLPQPGAHGAALLALAALDRSSA